MPGNQAQAVSRAQSRGFRQGRIQAGAGQVSPGDARCCRVAAADGVQRPDGRRGGPPGITGFAGGRPKATEIISYWPALIDKHKVTTKVTVKEV